MYEEFYAMQEKPFDLLPDPDFLYMSSEHDKTYNYLRYAIQENKGFVVISGEVGCGKTTLINYLLRHLPEDLQVGVISHTDVNPELFLKLICRKFELAHEGLDKKELLAVFQNFLTTSRQKNKQVTLIIDEAQNLPDKTIEEVHRLSSLESEKEHLVQIILVGQPELLQKLHQPHLEQPTQQENTHHLGKLNQVEVKEYIGHRLHVAGCPTYATLFSDAACLSTWKASQGIPRKINYICDMALVHGYADGLATIDDKTIGTVLTSHQESTLSKKEKSKEVVTPTRPAEAPESAKAPDMSKLLHRITFLESMVNSLNTQLQEQLSTRKVRDKLTFEIFTALQESLKTRQKIAVRYQKTYRRYRKLHSAVKKHLGNRE